MTHPTRTARVEEGATAVEYGVLVGAVGIALLAAGPYLWRALLSVLTAVIDDGILG